MSFTYDYAYYTGHSTGTTGIELFKTLSFFVSGLKYDGIGIDITEYRWFTGYGIVGSGTIATEISGRLNYDVDSQYWRTDVSIPSGAGAGATATGIFTFEYNTGIIAGSTGWATTGHMLVFGSKALDAWNMLTLEDGVKNNADILHTHAAFARSLYELDDVFVPGSIPDGNALIYFAASGGWTTGVGGGDPDDWDAVSGEVAEITGTLPGHIADGSAHHTAIVAGDLLHNSLDGLNADTSYEHITQTQKDALHTTDEDNIILVDATPPSNADYHGTILQIDTAGCSNYQVVYCDGANSVLPADADAISTCKIIGMVVASGKVLTDGIIRNDSWTLTPNAVYFASTTPGAITTTKPTGNTDVVIAIGIAVGIDQLLIRPGYAWVEVVV